MYSYYVPNKYGFIEFLSIKNSNDLNIATFIVFISILQLLNLTLLDK